MDLNVNFIYNDSSDLNITLIPGNKGIKVGGIPFDSPPVNGIDGNVSQIVINYFDNKKEDSIQINSLNSKNSSIFNDFIINSLRPNSFLPKSVKLLRKGTVEIGSIGINGCFIGTKQTPNQYEFYTRHLDLNLLNMGPDVVNNINFYGIYDSDYSTPLNLTCNYCDLNEPSSKVAGSYSIYSTIDGNINAMDLNIYYAKADGSKLGLDNPIYSGYPIYRNKGMIYGKMDLKTGLYQYEIKSENLIWYDNPEYKPNVYLEQTSKPFCVGQQYYIQGNIEGVSFGFPFTPIFKQWGN